QTAAAAGRTRLEGECLLLVGAAGPTITGDHGEVLRRNDEHAALDRLVAHVLQRRQNGQLTLILGVAASAAAANHQVGLGGYRTHDLAVARTHVAVHNPAHAVQVQDELIEVVFLGGRRIAAVAGEVDDADHRHVHAPHQVEQQVAFLEGARAVAKYL